MCELLQCAVGHPEVLLEHQALVPALGLGKDQAGAVHVHTVEGWPQMSETPNF